MTFKLGDRVTVKALTRKHIIWYTHEAPNELDPEIPIPPTEAFACGTKNWKAGALLNEPLTGIVYGKKYEPKGYYVDGGPCLIITGSVPVYLVAVSLKQGVMAKAEDMEKINELNQH